MLELTNIHSLTNQCTPFRQLAKGVTRKLKRSLPDFDDNVTLPRHFSLLVCIFNDENWCSIPVQRDAALVPALGVIRVQINAGFKR